MNDKGNNSYTSASGHFPMKMFLNDEVFFRMRQDGIVIPVHVQLYPTNKCNLNCEFCSCSEREKELEIDYDEIVRVMGDMRVLGCQGVTISGGGEPCLHPRISDVISHLNFVGIKVGLVTNGLLLDKVDTDALNNMVWCRVSFDGSREFWDKLEPVLSKAIERAPDVDWALSYVLDKNHKTDIFNDLVRYAKSNFFTHIRVVDDILNPIEGEMERVRKETEHVLGDCSDLIIWQNRETFKPGTDKCYISLLKPIISPDGFSYPCCGTQFASMDATRNLHKSMNMGKSIDLVNRVMNQKFFDGRVCERCFYMHYNDWIKSVLSGTEHIEFV